MTSTGLPLGGSFALASAGNHRPEARSQPLKTYNFAVEIEGLIVGGFQQVDGLASSITMESYREGGVNGYVHQFPDVVQSPPLVLRHGLTVVPSLWLWYEATSRGAILRKNGTIALLNHDLVPVMWWNFRQALPVRWTGPTFHAHPTNERSQSDGDTIGFESIELVHQGISQPLIGNVLAGGLQAFGQVGQQFPDD